MKNSNCSKALIKLNNANKVFYTTQVKTSALNNVNLTVNKGDSVAIVGASGSGKSTLLSAIGLIEPLTEGDYFFEGRNVSYMSASEQAKLRAKHIGYVFQSFLLIDTLTVFDNVALALKFKSLSKSEIKQKVEAVLDRVGMSHRAKHYPTELSGGQQQRVAIARAIVAEPDLLLADEPTGNLDTKNSQEIMEILRELHTEGKTLITVTHSAEVAAICNHQVSMKDGVLEV